MSIRILIADDHKMMRQGLRALLEKEDDMEVVGEAENGRQAVKSAENLSPDVVVMDIGMRDLNGIEATTQIIERCRGTKVLALSMHSDRRFAAGMLRAGASGYLLKDGAFEELANAIRRLVAGEVYLSPSIADVVVSDYVERLARSDASAFSTLTPREREVLQLLAEGHSTKQIASQLRVSAKTIETHRQNVMEKLGIRSVAELTKYAIREGLTSLDA